MSQVDSHVPVASLVAHAEALEAELPLAQAQAEVAKLGRSFVGVVSQGRFVGVVSDRLVNQILSSRFGHALFGRSPVRNHVMDGILSVAPDAPVTEVLGLASSRPEEHFFEDVAVVGSDGQFVGLIPIHRLVRLQNALLTENLKHVENQRLELAARNRHMEDDLKMAREVQLAILPDAAITLVHAGRRLTTDQFYRASESIGGDFFAFVRSSDESLGVLVCDVMGHSVRSALITTILSALVRDACCQKENPAELLTRLNLHLRGILDKAGETIFVTAAYAHISLSSGVLSYAQAGHPPALIWRAAMGKASEIALSPEAEGPALGLLDDPAYGFDRMAFAPGDALLMYTDGIVEAANLEGEEFGASRLKEAFDSAVSGCEGGVLKCLVDHAERFTGPSGFADDVCLVLVR